MIGKQFPIVLYWIAGGILNDEQAKEVYSFGPGTRIRNADHDTKDGALEDHDAVAGPDIPERYKDKNSKHFRPMAKSYQDYMKEHMKKVEGEETHDAGKEKLVEQTFHGGPDGKGGTKAPEKLETAPPGGGNRPDNAKGAAAKAKAGEDGWSVPS